jgi:hypothetical protein
MIRQRILVPKRIRIVHPQIDSGRMLGFWKANGPQVIQVLRALPSSKTDLDLRQAEILNPGEKLATFFDLQMQLRHDNFSGEALWTWNASRLQPKKQDQLISHFSGQLKSDGAVLNNLEFSARNWYSKLWGEWTGEQAQFNGFTFLNMISDRPNPVTLPKISVTFKPLTRVDHMAPFSGVSASTIYILDMKGKFFLEQIGWRPPT